MKKILLTLLLFSFAANAFAQRKGKLAGQIVDEESGEALIGASLLVEGSALGTSADIDGNYFLLLDEGTYNVVVSYISYQSKTIKNVKIKSGETTRLNVTCRSDEVLLDEVVVEAKILKNSESGLLIAQRNSNKIFDGLSSQQITKTADSNVGSALKRVTGVSVVGGKDVFVRGLGNRYSNVQLNGAELPSTNPDKKEAPLDVFSANLVDNIVVQKTYTADQPGEFSGGSVQIETKDFPDSRTLSVGMSTKYNTQSTFNSFLTYDGGSTDFLGYDSGERDLPSSVDGIRVTETGTSENSIKSSEVVKDFQNVWSPKSETALIGQSYSVSYGNQFLMNETPVGLIASVNYGYSNSSRDEDYRNLYQPSSVSSDYKVNRGNTNTSTNVMFNLFIKPTPTSKIGIKNVYTNKSEDQTTQLQGSYYNSDGDYKQTVLKFIQRNVFSTNVLYEAFAKKFMESKFNFEGSYAKARRYEPDTRNTHYAYNDAKDEFDIVLSLRGNSHFFLEQDDKNYNFKSTWEFKPISTLKIKTGGLTFYKDRDFQARRFIFDKNSKYTTDRSSLPEVALNPELVSDEGGLRFYESSQTSDSYVADQVLLAGFISTDFAVTEDLSFILGARIEDSDQRLNKESALHTTDILPAANATYKLRKDMNLRSAFSITLARPEFRELSEFFFTDFIGSRTIFGNPELKRTKIYNYDLRWEFYPNAGEILAVSGFYKRFKNPIEIFHRSSQNPEVFYDNVPKSDLYGLEFEARKEFFEHLKVTANLSLIDSEIDYEGEAPAQATQKRPMFGQSPYTFNINASYLFAKYNTEMTIAFNRFGKRIAGVGSRQQAADEYEMPFNKLDASFTYKLNNYKFKFSASNLLDDDVVYKQSGIVTNKYNLGTTFSVGVTYSL